jgi:hypothetical protein
VENLADLECQSLEGLKGTRQSTHGGAGGRLIVGQNGHTLVNHRRVETGFQDR